ncbi:MAG: hypothetical protein M3540_04830 [Actinomycetota bacterium]|nr:hypothetical protein [Actinomycetota bacterium]
MWRVALGLVATAAFLAFGAGPSRGGGSPHEGAKPWLWQCEQILGEEPRYRCYVRMLLLRVEGSGDPARELPRIDRLARLAGTSLAGRCHVLMHEVGRRYAARHRLTLATLQDAVPHSNDPTCSAGFGMGLIMQLGPKLAARGGAEAAARTCLRLPTRYRSYTCVHGLGHALMRGFHGGLRRSVLACRRLGPREAPDCAQGAFHDYWISLRGADGTSRPARADMSPRSVCNGHLWFVRPCWYRYFVEQASGPRLETTGHILRACRDLVRLQRSGCVAAASLAISGDSFAHTRLCGQLAERDVGSCLRGVQVQAVTRPARRLALIRACARLPRGTRRGCYDWFGRTLQVVSDGTFAGAGCTRLGRPARRACLAGAEQADGAMLTFS